MDAKEILLLNLKRNHFFSLFYIVASSITYILQIEHFVLGRVTVSVCTPFPLLPIDIYHILGNLYCKSTIN
jgi:hypothetical protein